MKKVAQKNLIKTAHHEAGHAVAAYLMKKKFKEISIVPEGDSLGHLMHGKWTSQFIIESDHPRRRDEIGKRIMVLLAGVIAEKLISGRYNHRYASMDYFNASGFAEYMTSSEKESNAYIDWLFERTVNLIEIHKDAVEVLAKKLIDLRWIGYKDAMQLIQNTLFRR